MTWSYVQNVMEPTKKIVELICESSKVSYFYILRMNVTKMKNFKYQLKTNMQHLRKN